MMVFGKEYASAYDYLYQDKDYKKECDFLEEIFSKFSYKVESILDLGCGTGGHAIILAKRGYHVVGVDRSEEMIGIAKRKARNEKLSIKFIKSDITDINLNEKFDAIISMFAVISYQTTNIALSNFCRIAKECLISGGVFIFDFWYGPAVISQKPTTCIKEVKLGNDERIVRFTEPFLDILNHTVETRFKVLKLKGYKLISETNENHLMRFLFPQEIKYYLQVAGFKDVKFFPFLKLEKVLTENDWNMTVVAKNDDKK